MVSPLVNLMKDKVDKLANLGILAASLSLSEITEENAKGVVEGKISIVYARPEAGLKNISTVDDFQCFNLQYVFGFTCH